MTLRMLRESVMRLLRNRSNLDSVTVDNYVNSAYTRICRGKFVDEDRTHRDKLQLFECLKKFTTLPTPIKLTFIPGGCVGYAYPTDCDVPLRVDFAGSELTRVPLPVILNVSEGTVELWADDPANSRVVLGYAADETVTSGELVILHYYANPAALTGDNQEPVIPEAYHPLIAILAARDLLYEFGEDERSRGLDGEFRKRLAEVASSRLISTAGKPLPSF